MDRNTKRKLHGIGGFLAFLFIATFWSSTVISELFFSHAAIASLKQTIVYAFGIFIPLMIIVGVTGNQMGGKSKHHLITAKRKRMPFIALNGLLILVPCAFFLNHRAGLGQFDVLFYSVQAVELIAGATNLTLMGLNIRDGLAVRKR